MRNIVRPVSANYLPNLLKHPNLRQKHCLPLTIVRVCRPQLVEDIRWLYCWCHILSISTSICILSLQILSTSIQETDIFHSAFALGSILFRTVLCPHFFILFSFCPIYFPSLNCPGEPLAVQIKHILSVSSSLRSCKPFLFSLFSLLIHSF